MDLKLYFDPVDESLNELEFSSDSLIQAVYLNEDLLPELDDMNLAIIGLKSEELDQSPAKQIREKLYNLKKGEGNCKIVDLGNLRSGPDANDTYKRIQAVCAHLISRHILPILIGGTHDQDFGQYLAYEEEEKLVTVLNVDARFDLDEKSERNKDRHVHQIFVHEPNYLFSYNHLAHQSYLVNPRTLRVLDQLSFSTLRLGEMRADFKKVEPFIREADMLTFDLSSVQKMYTPGATESQVFGLTGEEACQIMWYAGMNDKLSSIGIYEYDHTRDTDDFQTAMVVATMIWYFIEGFKNRKGERGFQTNDYVKYVVSMNAEPENIVFYKSRLSDKWWMEIPNTNTSGVYDRKFIIPCDEDDYELATTGEVPDRWISAYSRAN